MRLFKRYARCPDCRTARLSRLLKYDRIDRKIGGLFRVFLGIFGARIYHCRFWRLQFRDFHRLYPNRKSAART